MNAKSLLRADIPVALVVVILAGGIGCGEKQPSPRSAARKAAPAMSMTLTSPAFEDGRPIPKEHTGDGEDISPALQWSGVPEATASFVVICDDPDAPVGTWDHWVAYNLPPSLRELPAGAEPDGWVQGRNSWGNARWRGPSPPPGGAHRYFFRIYALDASLDLPGGADKKAVLRAAKDHTLAAGQLMGTYGR